MGSLDIWDRPSWVDTLEKTYTLPQGFHCTWMLPLGLMQVGILVVFPQRCAQAKGKGRAVFVLSLPNSTNVCLSWFPVHAEFRQRELQKTRGKFVSAQIWVFPYSTSKAHCRLSPCAFPSSLLHQKIWASFASPVGPQVSAQEVAPEAPGQPKTWLEPLTTGGLVKIPYNKPYP